MRTIKKCLTHKLLTYLRLILKLSQQGFTYTLKEQHGIYGPQVVVFLSSEPRAVSEQEKKKNNFFSLLELLPSFLAAQLLPPNKCSQSTVTQKKNKRVLAVYGIYGKMIGQYLQDRVFVANHLINTVMQNYNLPSQNKFYSSILKKVYLFSCLLLFGKLLDHLFSFLLLAFFTPLFGCPVLLSTSLSLITVTKEKLSELVSLEVL